MVPSFCDNGAAVGDSNLNLDDSLEIGEIKGGRLNCYCVS